MTLFGSGVLVDGCVSGAKILHRVTDHISSGAIDDDEAIVHPGFLLAQFQPAVILLEIHRGLSITWLDVGGQDPNAHLRSFVTQQSKEANPNVWI